MMYLDMDALVYSRRERGLPTDEASLRAVWDEMQSQFGVLMKSLADQMMAEWFSRHPKGTLIPSEVTLRIWNQARHRAVDQVMEDEVNGPMRDLLIRREDEEERQRQEELDARMEALTDD